MNTARQIRGPSARRPWRWSPGANTQRPRLPPRCCARATRPTSLPPPSRNCSRSGCSTMRATPRAWCACSPAGGRARSACAMPCARPAFPPKLATTALDSAPDWSLLAADVRRRKFGARIPRDWPGKARQMRFLQYRGFSKDHIASALGGSGADDPEFPENSPDDS